MEATAEVFGTGAFVMVHNNQGGRALLCSIVRPPQDGHVIVRVEDRRASFIFKDEYEVLESSISKATQAEIFEATQPGYPDA